MQTGLALLGRTGSSLATAKPHSSLPLQVADPNIFCSFSFVALLPACTQSPLAPSQIHSPPHSLSGSHVSDLSDVSSPNDLYRIHPSTLISIPCLFLPLFFPRYARSTLMRPLVSVPAFLFCLPNVDPSHNLPSKTWFTHSPATTSITKTMNNAN